MRLTHHEKRRPTGRKPRHLWARLLGAETCNPDNDTRGNGSRKAETMKIGDKVRITHKPEHDSAAAGRIGTWREQANGREGRVDHRETDGDFLVTVPTLGAMWFKPDELTPLEQTGTIEEARALAALNVSREAIGHRPVADWGIVSSDVTRAAWLAVVRTVDANNPAVQELRDELASVKAAHAEAERLLTEARADREVVERDLATCRKTLDEERRDTEQAEKERDEERTDAQHARDRLSAVKARADALGALLRTTALDRGRDVLAAVDALDRALAGVPATGEARPVPVAAAADRLASGHVQRLHDGTWEWCHDGGFDQGVVRLLATASAWLSETVDASRATLTEEQAQRWAEDVARETAHMAPSTRIGRLADAALCLSRGEYVPKKPAPANPDANPSRLEVLKRRVDRCDADVRDVMRRLQALEHADVEKSHVDARRPRIGAPQWNSDMGMWFAFDDRGQEAVRVYRAARNGWEGLVVRPLQEPLTIAAPDLEQALARAQAELGTWADVVANAIAAEGVASLVGLEPKPNKADDGEAGDDCPPSCTNPDPNHRYPALRGKRLADEQRARLHDGDPAKAKVAGPWHVDKDGDLVRREVGQDEEVLAFAWPNEEAAGEWLGRAWDRSRPLLADDVSGTNRDVLAACDTALVAAGWTLTGGIPEAFAAKAREAAEYDDALDVLPPRRPVEP